MNFKKKLNLGSLSPTRDFNFVTDTCLAFLSVSESQEVLGEVVNSASNFEVSIGETAELIAKVMDVDIEIEAEDKRVRPAASEVFRLYGDNNKLRNLTNWEPEYLGKKGFLKGLQKTIEWFSKKENLENYNFKKYLF